MSSESQSPEKIYQKYAWLILFVLGILLTLSSLFIIIRGTDPDVFQVDTGITWSEFSSAYPTVATLIILEERLIGTGLLGLGLYVSVITFLHYRKGERWSWYSMWIFPIVLALIAILMYLHEQAYVGIFYVGATGIALLGLLLPIRKFFPKPL